MSADVEKLTPLGDWVLVKVEKHPEMYKGAIYLPQGNLEERTGTRFGIVVATGPGELLPSGRRIPTGVEPGEKVIFRGFIHDVNKYHQYLSDMGYSLIKSPTDVLGVVED